MAPNPIDAPGALSLTSDDYDTDIKQEPEELDSDSDAEVIILPALLPAVGVDRKSSAATSLPEEIIEQ